MNAIAKQTYAVIGQQHLDGLTAHLQELQRERAELTTYLGELERRIAQQEGACNFTRTLLEQAAQAAEATPAAAEPTATEPAATEPTEETK